MESGERKTISLSTPLCLWFTECVRFNHYPMIKQDYESFCWAIWSPAYQRSYVPTFMRIFSWYQPLSTVHPSETTGEQKRFYSQLNQFEVKSNLPQVQTVSVLFIIANYISNRIVQYSSEFLQ